VRRILGAADLWITELVIAYDARRSYTVSIMEFRARFLIGKVLVRETAEGVVSRRISKLKTVVGDATGHANRGMTPR
jgi:hypothetical protein